MWVRGLKHVKQCTKGSSFGVAPYVGAWIETLSTRRFNETLASHPMWVRGLKHKIDVIGLYALLVAPYVGAWIET